MWSFFTLSWKLVACYRVCGRDREGTRNRKHLKLLSLGRNSLRYHPPGSYVGIESTMNRIPQQTWLPSGLPSGFPCCSDWLIIQNAITPSHFMLSAVVTVPYSYHESTTFLVIEISMCGRTLSLYQISFTFVQLFCVKELQSSIPPNFHISNFNCWSRTCCPQSTAS